MFAYKNIHGDVRMKQIPNLNYFGTVSRILSCFLLFFLRHVIYRGKRFKIVLRGWSSRTYLSLSFDLSHHVIGLEFGLS